MPGQSDPGIEAAEQLVDPGHAAEYRRLAADDAGLAQMLFGDQLGGDVHRTDVLGQQASGTVADVFGKGVLKVHGYLCIAARGADIIGALAPRRQWAR